MPPPLLHTSQGSFSYSFCPPGVWYKTIRFPSNVSFVQLIIGVPTTGKDRIEFNAHRLYFFIQYKCIIIIIISSSSSSIIVIIITIIS